MDASTKQAQALSGATLFSDLNSLICVPRTRRKTVVFAYGFIFTFVAFTAFLAFSPSNNSVSPFFNNFFASSSSSSSSSRSHFSSFFDYFFSNSSIPSSGIASNDTELARSLNYTAELKGLNQTERSVSSPFKGQQQEMNQSQISDPSPLKGYEQTLNQTKQSTQANAEQLNLNQTEQTHLNQTLNSTETQSNPPTETTHLNKTGTGSSPLENNITVGVSEAEQNRVSNLTASLVKQSNNGEDDTKKSESKEGMLESLMDCDVFDGNWVRDESYPLYDPGSCPHIDESFNCFLNGRPDRDFMKLRWQPKHCNIPRLNGRDMLELLRGRRLVFVGDSLNRNMWESLICTLRNSVKDKTRVFEASGRREFRTENSYLFVFKDYNCTVEFFRSPFLVQEWEMPEGNGSKKETLRLDLVERSSSKYKTADVIVFNTGHWWTHDKTSKGKDYYQEGSHVYDELNVNEAFRRALTTWAKWVDVNVNPNKTLVFFRGYSASHFSGGQWNSGGQCDDETEPIKNDTYLTAYPPKMRVLESVLQEMKTPISYMNITRMTDYRKDAHPSVYRKQKLSEEERKSPLRYQDCSHWCLPGVPDAWNELLYAKLLVKLNPKPQQQHEQKKTKRKNIGR